MERSGCDSGYGMGTQGNFTGIQAENPIAVTVTKEAGGSTVAPADVSRRRKPLMKKGKGVHKKKRISDSDDAFVPPPLPPNIMEQQGRLALLFSKKLHKSDVSNIGRIVLPKKPTEARLPVLLENDCIILPMNDIESGDAWSFKFRYWLNNRSRMYVLEGTGSFTKKHRLEAGDYILLYQDLVNHNYVIRGVRAYEYEEYEKQAKENKAREKDDDLMNQSLVGVFNDFDVFNLPDQGPSMEDLSLMNDNSYFSDILNSFNSWDEFMTNNYQPIQQITSFENLSSEDLSQV